MDYEIKNPPEFTQSLSKFEPTERNHARIFNERIDPLLNNDVYLKQKLEQLFTDSLAPKVASDTITKLLDIQETGTYFIYDGSTKYEDYPAFFKELGLNYGLLEVTKNCGHVIQKLTVVAADGTHLSSAICFINTASGDTSGWKKINDGGDAAQLNGVDSSGFFRRYDLNQINIDNTTGCWSTDVSVNDGSKGTLPPNVAWCSVRQYVSQGEHFFAQIGQDFNHTKLFYRNRYSSKGEWSNWHFVGDGGNAKTLDGITSDRFFKRYQCPEGTSVNTVVQSGIHVCTRWVDIPSEAILNNDTQGTVIVFNYNELRGTIGVDNIWLKQQFISPHNNGSFTRYVYGKIAEPWRKDANETVINRLAHTNFFNYTPETNLNTLLTTGCYQLGSSSHALSTLNFPLAGVGGILRVEGNGNVRTQTYYAFAGKSNFVRVFYRHYFKNAETGEVYWSEWDEKIGVDNVSNPNLLDNPDFKINQRGQESYNTPSKYTVDRWLRNSVPSSQFLVTVAADGITLDTTNYTSADTAKGTLLQYIENYEALLGKTMTISVNIGGIIYTKEVTIPTRAGSTQALSIASKMDVFLYYNGSNRLAFNIRLNNGVTITIKRVKLEVGSCSTPFVPPNPALELLKCQRYYEFSNTICGLIFYGNAFQGTQFKVQKRLIPTITVRANVVGASVDFTIKEVGYPTDKGFTFVEGIYYNAGENFPPLSPIYYTYVADAEIY